MKLRISRAVASGINAGLTLLRNRENLNLTREEIRWSRISFSQFGEDLAVLRWAEKMTTLPRLYVDAGCFHPVKCSNTLLLNKKGWAGVNIDMDEQKIATFKALRPNDINIVA